MCQWKSVYVRRVQLSSVLRQFSIGFSQILSLTVKASIDNGILCQPVENRARIALKYDLNIAQRRFFLVVKVRQAVFRLYFTLFLTFRKSPRFFRRKPICESFTAHRHRTDEIHIQHIFRAGVSAAAFAHITAFRVSAGWR